MKSLAMFDDHLNQLLKLSYSNTCCKWLFKEYGWDTVLKELLNENIFCLLQKKFV